MKFGDRIRRIEKLVAPAHGVPLAGYVGYGGYFYTDNDVLGEAEMEAHKQEHAEKPGRIPHAVGFKTKTLEEMKEHWRRHGIEGAHFDALVAEYEEIFAAMEKRDKQRLKRQQQE
jgi:hypothetical protein